MPLKAIINFKKHTAIKISTYYLERFCLGLFQILYPCYLCWFNRLKNKNDNIHKWEAQEIRSPNEHWKYRVDADITENHIILKLIFMRNIILKFMMIRQLFHAIMYVKMSELTCLMFTEFLSQLTSCYTFQILPNYMSNHHTELKSTRQF